MIANGEIWSVADALRCREVSGCVDLMSVEAWSLTLVSRALRAHDAGVSADAVSWSQLRPLITDFNATRIGPRLAQASRWPPQTVAQLRRRYPRPRRPAYGAAHAQ